MTKWTDDEYAAFTAAANNNKTRYKEVAAFMKTAGFAPRSHHAYLHAARYLLRINAGGDFSKMITGIQQHATKSRTEPRHTTVTKISPKHVMRLITAYNDGVLTRDEFFSKINTIV